MKLRLDVQSLNDDFFKDTHLLGVTAHIRNYRFCWMINTFMEFDFRLNPDMEIYLKKNQKDYFFNIYESHEPDRELTHYLYQNFSEGEYLVPELRQMDYFWLMKGDWVEPETVQFILSLLRSLRGVQMATELDASRIKRPENLIF